jgi:hypothetical protein
VVKVKLEEVIPARRPLPATVKVVEVAAELPTLTVNAPVAVIVSLFAVIFGESLAPAEIPSAMEAPRSTVAAVAAVVPVAADAAFAPFEVKRTVGLACGTFPPTAYVPRRAPVVAFRFAIPVWILAVADAAEETVTVSVVVRRVVTPFASFGVIVNVADSPAAIDAEVAESENDVGAPATVHVTFVVKSPVVGVAPVLLSVSHQTR